jgi:hypothetical protein
LELQQWLVALATSCCRHGLVMLPHKSIGRGPIRKQLASPRWRRSLNCRDRAEALDLVRRCGDRLQLCSRQLQADAEVVAAAVGNEPSSLRFAAQELLEDRVFVLGLAEEDGRCLRFAAPALQVDAKVVAAAVSKHRGVAFHFVLPELVTAELVGGAVVAAAARGYWEDYTDLAADLEGLWYTLLFNHETWADVVAGLLRVFGGPWAGRVAAGQAWMAADLHRVETGFMYLQDLVRARQRLLLAQVLRQGQPDKAFVRLLDQRACWATGGGAHVLFPFHYSGPDEGDMYDQVVLALRAFVDRWAE